MERYPLEDLIELAAVATPGDSVVTPAANRASGCVSMSRLAAAARGEVSARSGLTPIESAHLASCTVCTARQRAFAMRYEAASTAPSVSPWRLRVTRSLPFAAAAALALLFSQPRPSSVTPQPRNAYGAVSVSVRYAPHQSTGRGEAQVDCFQSTAHEACTMLALFRTWNSACQCLMWELHRWEDGATLAEVASGESIDVRLDVANSPPVSQLFVLAVARERGDLPGRPETADELLECLNDSAPPLGVFEDAAAYTSAVSACLPSGVTVVPASFVPR